MIHKCVMTRPIEFKVNDLQQRSPKDKVNK